VSEERLQEIKDSVDFQREILLAQNLGTLCVDEEQELIDEIERLNNIINELEDSIVGKINVLYQVRGQSNAIQELSILLRQLRELKGSDKE
jgi:hypothetical protein